VNGPNAVVMETLAWVREVAPTVFAKRRDLHLDSARPIEIRLKQDDQS
jgi:hypothetical protein